MAGRRGGLTCKRADTDEYVELGPPVDLLEPLTQLLCSCIRRAVSRFRSRQVFHIFRPRRQLVSLISPAPSVLLLNAHKSVKTAVAEFERKTSGRLNVSLSD